MKADIDMDLLRVEKELKKRLNFPYKWGRKQSDEWDGKTNFIYSTFDFESLLLKIKEFDQELKGYAMNRWYNFWSAMAVEHIFTSHPNVQPNKNKHDKLVDFKINRIPFDHKTSVFPKGFSHSFEYAKKNETELLKWFYNSQSQQSRMHLKNRLFIVLYDFANHHHWKLKSEIMLLKNAVDKYVMGFSKDKLKTLNFGNGEVYSDMIWVIKE